MAFSFSEISTLLVFTSVTHTSSSKGLWRGVGEPLFSPNQKGTNEFVSGSHVAELIQHQKVVNYTATSMQWLPRPIYFGLLRPSTRISRGHTPPHGQTPSGPHTAAGTRRKEHAKTGRWNILIDAAATAAASTAAAASASTASLAASAIAAASAITADAASASTSAFAFAASRAAVATAASALLLSGAHRPTLIHGPSRLAGQTHTRL